MSALLGHAPVARPTGPAELTRSLYEKHGQRVFTFCYSRLHDREEAQDAAQTTFIYALRSIQRGVVPEFELAWLLKIAFNVCRGVRRSQGRDLAHTRDVEDIEAVALSSDSGIEETERVAALRDALAALPENQQRGILLREWQGLSYAEIADELGLSVAAVETLLFRARRNLASRLEHVRSGIGAFDLASLMLLSRRISRVALVKLGLLGAAASVALVPIVADELSAASARTGADVPIQRVIAAPEPPPSPRRLHVARRPIAVGRTLAQVAVAVGRPSRHSGPVRTAEAGAPAAAPDQAPADAAAATAAVADAKDAPTTGVVPPVAPPAVEAPQLPSLLSLDPVLASVDETVATLP